MSLSNSLDFVSHSISTVTAPVHKAYDCTKLSQEHVVTTQLCHVVSMCLPSIDTYTSYWWQTIPGVVHHDRRA